MNIEVKSYKANGTEVNDTSNPSFYSLSIDGQIVEYYLSVKALTEAVEALQSEDITVIDLAA